MQNKKFKLGLVPKLIIAIIVGMLVGQFLPESIVQLFVTFSSLFSSFLKFIIPFMIIGFVVMGIADLASGAGKLLGVTTLLAYGSTILAGSFALLVATNLFPMFIDASAMASIVDPEAGMLAPLFTIPLSPMIDVTAAIVFAFVMGLSISYLRGKNKGQTSYNFFGEFSEIIVNVLSKVIIPLLPFYILGTFANMTYSGQVFQVLSVFWKVFLIIIVMHVIYLVVAFSIAGGVGRKNPFRMLKNQVPGYLTAIGTQSSAATIPVNIECAEKNGVSKQIREFVIPLCATINLSGSIITITSCVTAVLMMNNMDHSFALMMPFILTLGIAMVAAPGAPGGAIFSALPFLFMVGIASDSALASLLVALYITQDSFGTAANVSGDNAIAVVVDAFYKKFIKKDADTVETQKTA